MQFLLYSLSSLIIGSPRRPSRRLFAASADIALRVAYDALAICGRITVEVNVKKQFKLIVNCQVQCSITDWEYSPQFLRVKSGWSNGSGSGTVTSRPAPAICPVDRASYRSSWLTTPPLKQHAHRLHHRQEKAAAIHSLHKPLVSVVWCKTIFFFFFNCQIVKFTPCIF